MGNILASVRETGKEAMPLTVPAFAHTRNHRHSWHKPDAVHAGAAWPHRGGRAGVLTENGPGTGQNTSWSPGIRSVPAGKDLLRHPYPLSGTCPEFFYFREVQMDSGSLGPEQPLHGTRVANIGRKGLRKNARKGIVLKAFKAAHGIHMIGAACGPSPAEAAGRLKAGACKLQ